MADEVDRWMTARRRRRSMMVMVTALLLPLVAYALAYAGWCHRRVAGQGDICTERWLIVRTPSSASGLFFPAACIESAIRGCWFGVVVHDPEWFRWELVFAKVRFTRGHRPPPSL